MDMWRGRRPMMEDSMSSRPLTDEECTAMRKHICKFYLAEFRHVKPCVWEPNAITDIEQMSIDLDMLEQMEHSCKATSRKRFGSHRTLTRFLETLPDYEEKKYRVYLRGTHKSGKSLAVKKLAYEWAKIKMTHKKVDKLAMKLKKYKFVFYVSLREANQNPTEWIPTYIKTQLLGNTFDISDIDVYRFLEWHQHKILLILDDLDDYNENMSMDVDKLLIVPPIFLPQLNIIFTTSPLFGRISVHTRQFEISQAPMARYDIAHYIAAYYKQKQKYVSGHHRQNMEATAVLLEARELFFWLDKNGYIDTGSLFPTVLGWICFLWKKTQSKRIQDMHYHNIQGYSQLDENRDEVQGGKSLGENAASPEHGKQSGAMMDKNKDMTPKTGYVEKGNDVSIATGSQHNEERPRCQEENSTIKRAKELNSLNEDTSINTRNGLQVVNTLKRTIEETTTECSGKRFKLERTNNSKSDIIQPKLVSYPDVERFASGEMPVRESELVKAMVEHILDTDCTKSTSCSKEEMKGLFSQVGKVVFHAIKDGKCSGPLSFNQNDFPAKFLKSSFVETVLMKTKKAWPTYIYRFAHPLFAHYFVAEYLANLCLNNYQTFEEHLQMITSLSVMVKIQTSLKFLCGISKKATSGILSHVSYLTKQSPCLGPMFRSVIDVKEINKIFWVPRGSESNIKYSSSLYNTVGYSTELNNMVVSFVDEMADKSVHGLEAYFTSLVALTGYEGARYSHLFKKETASFQKSTKVIVLQESFGVSNEKAVEDLGEHLDAFHNWQVVCLDGTGYGNHSTTNGVLHKLQTSALRSISLSNFKPGMVEYLDGGTLWKNLVLTELEFLSLYEVQIRAGQVIDILDNAPKLHSLHLEHNNFSYHEVVQICQVIRQREKMQELNLSNNDFTLENIDMQSFINNYNWQPQAPPATTAHTYLAGCFELLPTLTCLELSRSNMTAAGLRAIALNLKHLPLLQKLRLSNNGYYYLGNLWEGGFDALLTLFDALRHNTHLKILNLNSILGGMFHDDQSWEMMTRLCNSLQYTPDLEILQLGYMHVLDSNSAVGVITDTLRFLPKLQQLDLSHTTFSSDTTDETDRNRTCIAVALERYLPHMKHSNGYGAFWAEPKW